MTDLTYIYSLLVTGMLGGLLGVGLCISAAIGNSQVLNEPLKMNYVTTSAALSFSSAIYCLVVFLILFVEVVVEIPSEFIWAAAALGGGSVLAALTRGMITRNRIANNNWEFTRHIITLAALEILVLPGLVYSLIVLFV